MMRIYIRLLLIFGLFLNFSNLLLADNNFFKKVKKNTLKKTMMNLNFYFREA